MLFNYPKEIKPLDFTKKPKKQPIWAVFLTYIVSKLVLAKTKYQIKKTNMKGLKPPYLILSNHMYFEDFEIAAIASFPRRVTNIASLDGFVGLWRIMLAIGILPKRKFINDTNLFRQINHAIKKNKTNVCIYPEARYTAVGTTAVLPESLFKMVKLLGVPVVVTIHHGNHIHRPFWNYSQKRKVPLCATMKQVLSEDDVKNFSVEQIEKIIKKEFEYDEYKYLLENNYQINESYRAEGLHKILYQCPVCKKEHQMTSFGSTLKCEACETEWEMQTNGQLKCKNNDYKLTKLNHIPTWYEWQREQVKKQIEEGKYKFEDRVKIFSLPHPKKFVDLGEAIVTHSLEEGFAVKGNYNGQEFTLIKKPLESYSLHVEYDCVYLNKKDTFSLANNEDTFYMEPSKPNVITKLALATEEIYKINKAKLK